jgi:hypothetical protein
MSLLLVVTAGRLLDAQGTQWRIEQPDVRVVCPMTVGGSFEVRTRALTGTLTAANGGGALDGQIVVDLRTLDAGIDLRTRHLRDTYLEVGKGEGFDQAILSKITVGALEGRVAFDGTLQLHGTARPVSGMAELRRASGGLRVEATFPVTIAAFAIAEPRYLGVGVRDVVQVRVSFMVKPMGGTQS